MKPAKRRKPTAIKISALTIIAVLMTTAGMSRLGLGLSAALAEADMARDTEMVADPGDPMDLLTALRMREADLEAREAALTARMGDLQVAEDRLASLLSEMDAAERALADTMATTQTAAEDDLTRLTVVYENMKPENAAILFEEMEPGFAAGFIARLRPDVAAQILAGLPPRTAYGISAILAGRNALVPTQ
ncbi:MotE family protein [Roseicitreum antarcticum]|uniref:MgtE intracellular N domain-containing protein n=1 Tax=Roseicitreum antarcticum TaxID=564137 RepID=A0A1H2URB5_9RHOB|nr:hypothetical protein [Roseicitreum antarcticum]SDW58590.1 MgtE intracellular N domain-containing protein [Roseicitreum antarcticum]